MLFSESFCSNPSCHPQSPLRRHRKHPIGDQVHLYPCGILPMTEEDSSALESVHGTMEREEDVDIFLPTSPDVQSRNFPARIEQVLKTVDDGDPIAPPLVMDFAHTPVARTMSPLSSYTASQLPRLPIEVIEHAISFLPKMKTGDGSSRYFRVPRELYDVALTCRALLHCCRHHLFSRITLIENEDVARVVELTRQASMAPFLAHVHELQILGYYNHILNSIPHLLALHLPNVKTLTIDTANWSQSGPHFSFFFMFARFISVTTLSLSRCGFLTFRQFSRLVCALP